MGGALPIWWGAINLFSTTYWLRHPELLVPVLHRSLGCSALRQIAREFGRSHTTVMRLAERMGRHCLLLRERLRPRVPVETLVLDWRNYIKSTSERRRDPPPGVQLGVIPKALGVEEVLEGRNEEPAPSIRPILRTTIL